MPKKTKINEANRFFFVMLLTLLVMLLTFANVSLFFTTSSQDDVLGVSTEVPEELVYLENFLESEPSYLPGWIEKARIEKELGLLEKYNESVEKIIHIDPNYKLNF